MEIDYSTEEKTIEHLLQCGVTRKDAERIAYSGYMYWKSEPQELLMDSFYGTTISYQDILSPKMDCCPHVQTEHFSSLEEANEIVRQFEETHRKGLLLTYRGINKEFFLCDSKLRKRYFTNPYKVLIEGKEPSLLPTYWREYIDDSKVPFQEQFFRTFYGKHILYHGINFSAIKKLQEEDESFCMSDVEGHEDSDSKELYKRWQNSMHGEGEAALIAQHYGLKTRFLDLTFDLNVAIFFSLYHFIRKDNGKATYEYNANEEAAVYCFDFDNLIREESLFKNSKLFEHAIPERPMRQKCTGFFTSQYDMNGAADYLVLRLKPSINFDLNGVPTPDVLFPSREKDRFYDLLLRYKEKEDESSFLNETIASIIEYEI